MTRVYWLSKDERIYYWIKQQSFIAYMRPNDNVQKVELFTNWIEARTAWNLLNPLTNPFPLSHGYFDCNYLFKYEGDTLLTYSGAREHCYNAWDVIHDKLEHYTCKLPDTNSFAIQFLSGTSFDTRGEPEMQATAEPTGLFETLHDRLQTLVGKSSTAPAGDVYQEVILAKEQLGSLRSRLEELQTYLDTAETLAEGAL